MTIASNGLAKRNRYAIRFAYVGLLSTVGVGSMVLPLFAAIGCPSFHRVALAFLAPALLVAVPGLWLWFRRDRMEQELRAIDGCIIVTLTWLVVSLASSWPFVALDGLDFDEAVFEAVSGWTTTGLSMIDVEHAGPATLFWRSTMQLLGGAGFAVIMLAAVGQSRSNAIGIAEGRSDQLAAHVKASARLVVALYGTLVLVGTLGYLLLGLSAFDALNHSFCALSTGGFSTRAASIGFYDSPAVESFTIALMILGSTNFATIWLAFRGRFRAVVCNGELRVAATTTVLAVLVILPLTTSTLYSGLTKQMRVAVFETVSALTTTGFSTVGYGNWNDLGILVMVLLMLIGGGTCSTAGGLKQFRVYVLFRTLVADLARALAPSRVVLPTVVAEGEGHSVLSDSKVREVSTYCFLYLAVLGVGVGVLTACGIDMRDSVFEFASALGTVGLSVGVTSRTLPGGAVWCMTAAMFFGRLEFTVVLVTIAKMAGDVIGRIQR